MSLPFVIWVIIFKYIPLWGWTMAFQQYIPGKGFFQQEWVGLKYFIIMFQDNYFYLVLRNTLAMSILSLIFGFTLPIVLAILLNEITKQTFKRMVQTISYLPHFVSWVIVASLFNKMLSIDDGVVNNILMALRIVEQPVQFMAKPNFFWGIVTFADVWKEIGWNSIIFLAAIAGISPELYESAMVDGAGRFKKIWHITLPGILPTVMVILIMSIGNLINIGFEKQFLMRNSLVRDYSDVLDLYILDYGISAGRWAFGTAAGMFKSLVSIILVFTANGISRKVAGIGIITK
ncbi:MAG: ABC transporter permease subunit [Bacillota bacterium]|nr:ABC transporter permease subunit [Bacillota bacterium]